MKLQIRHSEFETWITDDDDLLVLQLGNNAFDHFTVDETDLIMQKIVDRFNSYEALEARNRELIKRALKAETEWATFRQLTELAKQIIERDYPFGVGHSRPAVVHFLQRSEAALNSPSLNEDSTNEAHTTDSSD